MFTVNRTVEHRKSTETDQRHLLDESVTHSETASLVPNNEDGDKTPRARSPVREGTTTARPYRGFPSEAHYLAALQEWAESKKYLEPETMLVGFYGPKTVQDYGDQPGVEIGLKKKWRARKERKAERRSERRNTVA